MSSWLQRLERELSDRLDSFLLTDNRELMLVKHARSRASAKLGGLRSSLAAHVANSGP